jgi:hypothetical protein
LARYVHHITHISRIPKTDPEGEGTTEVWELLAQQHAITLQNTAAATNIALCGILLEVSVPDSELVLWQSERCGRW